MEREAMEFDVVIVGAGPSGLATACHLRQLAAQSSQDISVCVVEKGSEIGAHILSGAIIDPKGLNELFPDWQEKDAPLPTPVSHDEVFFLTDNEKAIQAPNFLIPKPMHNDGNYVISLGNLCRWLAEQAESLGAEVFPGFAVSEILYDEDGQVKGVATGDMGLNTEGEQKDSYMPGMELHAKYTVLSEGCRGNLGKEMIEKFQLSKGKDPQHYGLGIKELWDIPSDKHQPGLVVHTAGWPLNKKGVSGGGFLYHSENNQVVVGLIVDLNYQNPHLSPFDEFQRYKHHPAIAKYLEGGKRVSYGARAITKGGFNSLPQMYFPGGLLIGCDAGTLNFAKIKGTHTAIKSGMLAAEAIQSALESSYDAPAKELSDYETRFKASWVYDELYSSRNFGSAMHKYGLFFGAAFNFVDQNIFNGQAPWTLNDKHPDHACLRPAEEFPVINYPKPDGVISFDKLSSVFLSNTNHEEDQPCHLKLTDPTIPVNKNLPMYNEPAQRYCPAGVYEVVEENNTARFQINAQNCVHCKTCDIKDPAQNITWTTPEGTGGPNYPNM